jgi:hypothetical protein
MKKAILATMLIASAISSTALAAEQKLFLSCTDGRDAPHEAPLSSVPI